MDESGSGSDLGSEALDSIGGGRVDSDNDSDDEPRTGLGGGSARGLRGTVLGKGGKRVRQPRDESLYGVFAKGGGAQQRGRFAHGERKQPASASKQVTFVRGDTLRKAEVDAPQPKDAGNGESDDDIDPRFRFDGAVGQKALVEQGPKLPARNKLSFGQMASNYGKGFEILKKMGFQGGGLGAREDGIANPIEVIKRKRGQGLQDEGEMLDQDLYGHDAMGSRRSVEELLTPKAPKKQDEAARASEGWRRDATKKKPRVVYKTAAEEAMAPKLMRIVDMRGPEVCVASSFAELAASISGDSVKSLKELRHNVHLLVRKCEDKIRALAEKRKHFQDTLLSVAREKERLEGISTIGPQDLHLCKKLVKEVEELRERQDNGSVGLQDLGAAFQQLQSEHPREFKALRLLDVAVALAVPTARRELGMWQPLEDPEQGISMLTAWRQFMDAERPQAFSVLCDSLLLPPLRAALCDWEVLDFEPCLRLFECCRKAWPVCAVNILSEQVLLPRLRARIDSWDPRVDKIAIHMWLHPWLPMLGNSLECLWAPIRFKLSKCLDRWDPRDHSAYEVLRPWRLVFDPSNWEPLIEKVLTRLERYISEVPVRPDGQDVAPFKDLLMWADLAPASGLAHILEVAFFPQWHAALSEWLRAPGCNYEEVLQWYQGWKRLLPEELQKQGVVQKHFAHGLAVMKHFMASENSGESTEPAPIFWSSLPSEAKPSSRPAKAPTTEDVSLSLCDYIAEVAGEHGLVFRPKKTLHLGKQVYQLGNISIYLDKNMVHAASKAGEGSNWRLVSLDDMLNLARVANGRAQ